jgi:hypothetical protein
MQTFGWEANNMRHVYILWLQNLLSEAKISAKAYKSLGGQVEGISDVIDACQHAINALREAHDEII